MDSEKIKQICVTYGADLVGITSVERLRGAPEGFGPEDVLPGCRSVIVMARRFPAEALHTNSIDYTNIRNTLVQQMNELARHVALAIRTKEDKSKPVTSISGKWKNGRFYGPISLKHAGEAAGLGKIGRNYLLTNNRMGNMIWLSAVLTTIELEADPLATYEICNNCRLCVDKCPSQALNENIFNQKACRQCCYKTAKGILDLKCWNCRKVCPNTLEVKN